MADTNANQQQASDSSKQAGPTDPQPPASAQQTPAEPAGSGGTKNWIVGGIVAAAAVAFFVFSRVNVQEGGEPAVPKVGTTLSGDITLVTADRNELDCAAKNGVQNFQCGFDGESRPRQIDDRQKLRPFMTLDRQLYLIPGLFFDPAIEARYKTELPNKPRSELKRFTAKCQVKVVGELAGVKLRWGPDAEWEAPRKAAVATVSNCHVEG